jgi:hypothetical protein
MPIVLHGFGAILIEYTSFWSLLGGIIKYNSSKVPARPRKSMASLKHVKEKWKTLRILENQ